MEWIRRLPSSRIIAFALPANEASDSRPATSDWVDLFDGSSLDGWVQMNGAHRFAVEDGAIVGRTVEASASTNSFLCTRQEFDDFELELETAIDPITNSGVQIRSMVRPLQTTGRAFESAAGRVNGPQVEIRRFYKGEPASGLLYGEAMEDRRLAVQRERA